MELVLRHQRGESRYNGVLTGQDGPQVPPFLLEHIAAVIMETLDALKADKLKPQGTVFGDGSVRHHIEPGPAEPPTRFTCGQCVRWSLVRLNDQGLGLGVCSLGAPNSFYPETSASCAQARPLEAP